METMIFCVTMGIWSAFLFVMIGVAIGKADDRLNKKHNKGNARDVRGGHNNRHIRDCGTCNMHDRDVGNDNREESRRCDIRMVREMSNDGLAATLRGMALTGIIPTDYERAYLHEAADRLEGMYEDND